jgi:hypothetical protein
MRYPTSQTSIKPGTPLGVFNDYDSAEDYAGACAQELKEKVGYGVFFCKVELTTFYD